MSVMASRCLPLLTILAATGAWAAPPDIDMAIAPAAEASWLTPLWKAMPSPSGPETRAWFEHELDNESEPTVAETDSGATPEAPDPEVAPTIETVSIGKPARGWLVEAERLADSGRISTRERSNYGTHEMVSAIRDAVDAVHAKFPEDTPRLVVGDLSRKGGGPFRPHKSHQSGRDADIGFYFVGRAPEHLARATARTIDAGRTWTFVASLLADDKVEYLFLDYRLQRELHRYAKDVAKVPAEKLARWFQYPKGRKAGGVIRHLRGHDDHMHVRFHAPGSIAAATRYVEKHGLKAIKPLPRYYKVRRGDYLGKIARRHKVSIKKLTRWNRIKRKKTLHPGNKLIVGWRRPRLPTP